MATLTEHRARELFDARRTAWLAEDAGAYLALWHSDMTIEMPDHRIEGLDAYAKLIDESFAAMAPVAWEFHHVLVRDDVVAAEWTISARHRASGGLVEWTGMSVCGIDDDRIRWWREYWNPASLRP